MPLPLCLRASSNRYDKRVKSLGRDGKTIFLQSSDVLLNRIAGVLDGILSRATLRDASRKAWALSHPLPILSSAHDDLAHGPDFRISP